MDRATSRHQEQEDVLKLVAPSSEKRAKLLRLVEERKRSETFLGYTAGSVKGGNHSATMSPSQPGVRLSSNKPATKSESNPSDVRSTTNSSGWIIPTRAKDGDVQPESESKSSKPASTGTSTATAMRGEVKKSVYRHKWIDGVSVDTPIQSKGTNAKTANDSSSGASKLSVDKPSLLRPAPTGLESQAGKLAVEVKESERSGQFRSPFFDGTGAFATKTRIAGIYNPAFTSKIHSSPVHLESQNNAFSDTVARAGINTKPVRPTKILSSPLRGTAAVDDGFDVVGTAELERDDGFDRLEVPAFSADNGKGELTFWEDEEDEEEWLESWDEGGLAEPKVKAGIDGRKGREVRFMAGL